MPSVYRPAFVTRRLVTDRGGDGDWSLPSESGTYMVSRPKETFESLEPLIVALLVAGYTVPYAVAGLARNQAPLQSRYIQLWPESGKALFVASPWPADTGLDAGMDAWNFIALRVLARREADEPLIEPVELAGIDAWVPWQNPADPADRSPHPLDGWLLMPTPDATSAKTTSELAADQAPDLTAVIAGLVAQAMDAAPAGRAPGCVGMFDPSTWTVPQARTIGMSAFISLAEPIWAHLSEPAAMQALLTRGNDDWEATLYGLLYEAGYELADEDYYAITDALDRRRALLMPLDANMPLLLGRWWTLHWALWLMQLHDYGMAYVLPTRPPSPAIPVIDLTGLYQSIPPAGIGTMQLNQAGPRLTGWYYDRLQQRWEVEGDVSVAAGRLTAPLTRTRDGTTMSGRIEFTTPPGADDDALVLPLTWNELSHPMMRRNRRAQQHPTAMVGALAPAGTQSNIEPLSTPLHPQLAKAMDDLADSIAEELETVSAALPGGETAVRVMDGNVRTKADTLDLADYDGAGKLVETPLVRRLRAEMPRRLGKREIAHAGYVDGWAQLLSVAKSYPADVPRIIELLAIPLGKAHDFEFDMSGVGLEFTATAAFGFHVGSFTVKSSIRHMDPCPGAPDNDPAWDGWYFGRVLQGGLACGPKGELAANFVFWTSPSGISIPEEWTREDFLCWFVFGELSAGGGYHAGGGAEGGVDADTFAFVRDRDGMVATGTGTGVWATAGAGAGLGGAVGLSGLSGYWDRMWHDKDNPPPPPQEPPKPSLTEIAGTGKAEAMFEVDEATLTPEGRALIADAVSRERALLEDPGSYLLVEGDTSRTADQAHNEPLSRARALSAYRYVRDLLTAPQLGSEPPCTAYTVKDGHTRIASYGEIRAEWTGLPDDVEDDDLRKATVIIRGRSMVLL
jgi:hypothetical protein